MQQFPEENNFSCISSPRWLLQAFDEKATGTKQVPRLLSVLIAFVGMDNRKTIIQSVLAIRCLVC